MTRNALLAAALAACSGSPTMAAPDASADVADVAADAPREASADVVDAGPPPPQGSTEALLEEACAGRARRGEAMRFAYSTAPDGAVGALREMRPGDFEAVHLVVERPVRVERLRLTFRGEAGGRVRVKVTDDYGRTNPDVARDLVPPVELAYASAEPVTVTLPRPLDLHPARHAWVVVEHLAEPMGLVIAASRGGSYRSYYRSEALIARLRAMGGDAATFRWVQVAGMNNAALEFAVEAEGQWICPRQGAAWFSDATQASGLTGTTHQTSAVDVDRDGWDDLVGARTVMDRDALQVWRNRRDGRFEDVTARLGLEAATGKLALWGDLDGDGDLDAYAGVYRDGVGPFDPPSQSRVWVQSPDGRFARRDDAMEPTGPTAAGAVGDCDRDGAPDLVVGQWLRQYPRNPAPDFVFRGLGGARFEDFTARAGLPARPDGRPTYGATFADWDDDGDQDLFVANYGGSLNEAWRNDGRCRFTNVAEDIGLDADLEGVPGTSFGMSFADWDGDGDLDVYETNIAHPRYDEIGTDRSRLLRNGGAPDWRMEEVTRDAGILYTEGEIASAWGDWDNDGDQDLYVAITYPFQFSRLYRQEADHGFSDVTWLAGVATELNGRALWLDVDRDGRLDLVTAPSGAWRLFHNDTRNNNHWLSVTLAQPTGNTLALGARVTVTDSAGVARVRELQGGSTTWATQPSLAQHVGLGAAAGPARVRVRWPDGMTTEYPGLAVDRAWRIVRGTAPTALPR